MILKCDWYLIVIEFFVFQFWYHITITRVETLKSKHIQIALVFYSSIQQWWGQQQLLCDNCCEFLFKQTWGQRSDFVLLFIQRVYFCPMCLPKKYYDILENTKLFIGDIIHYDFPHASIPRNWRILILFFLILSFIMYIGNKLNWIIRI